MDARRLRVMAEYGSSGVWAVRHVGPWRQGMLEHRDLALPTALSRRFDAWIESYSRFLDDALDTSPFNDEGWALARELQHHLGSTARVSFVAETVTGICADREVVDERDLPDGWVLVGENARNVSSELSREVGPGHPLDGVRAIVFARRFDRDDVLCAIEHKERAWALVHLTWSGERERPPWPKTTLCTDWAAFRAAGRS